MATCIFHTIWTRYTTSNRVSAKPDIVHQPHCTHNALAKCRLDCILYEMMDVRGYHSHTLIWSCTAQNPQRLWNHSNIVGCMADAGIYSHRDLPPSSPLWYSYISVKFSTSSYTATTFLAMSAGYVSSVAGGYICYQWYLFVSYLGINRHDICYLVNYIKKYIYRNEIKSAIFVSHVTSLVQCGSVCLFDHAQRH